MANLFLQPLVLVLHFLTCCIMSDILFSTVEKMHGSRLWGKFLDAGTGLHSIKWVQTLPTTSWTAITADNYMRTQMVSDSSVSSKLRPVDQLIVGNWMNDGFNRLVLITILHCTCITEFLLICLHLLAPLESTIQS